MNKQNLYDWVFHYNHFTDLWGAARRDDKDLLFSSIKSDKILRSKNIQTLIELICITNGDKQKINNLCKK